MSNIFHFLANESRRLTRVNYYYPKNGKKYWMLNPVIIELMFKQNSYFVYANPFMGSLELVTFRDVEDMLAKRLLAQNASSLLPWKDALKKRVLWIWKMDNQSNGLVDGIQIEFVKTLDYETCGIQLISMMDTISVSRVHEYGKEDYESEHKAMTRGTRKEKK